MFISSDTPLVDHCRQDPEAGFMKKVAAAGSSSSSSSSSSSAKEGNQGTKKKKSGGPGQTRMATLLGLLEDDDVRVQVSGRVCGFCGVVGWSVGLFG
jgi:hypothetical protein